MSKADKALIIHRGRTNVITCGVGFDISADTITSEIRVGPNENSDLVAAFDVAFLTDGVDGELVLTLDDDVTRNITHTNAYMDLKRVTGGEPMSIFLHPIRVTIQGVVTQ